jgi:RecA-family ATPase
MLDRLLAQGDLTLMIGEPGIGKSWISLGLAVAVAEGHDTFLGRKLTSPNPRVLYVDEENPELLVLHRMRKLGLTPDGAKNIRFLHRQGIRLDKRPELLQDEALDWEPGLTVLDSLTRMHTQDENNAGAIAALFNDGINPLARETGATTLLLHHVTKTESTSGFVRARGSGDISASVDSGIDIRQTDVNGGFNVHLFKSRWVEEGHTIRARRRDVDDYVALEAEERGKYF